jgi:hypothetical protein
MSGMRRSSFLKTTHSAPWMRRPRRSSFALPGLRFFSYSSLSKTQSALRLSTIDGNRLHAIDASLLTVRTSRTGTSSELYSHVLEVTFYAAVIGLASAWRQSQSTAIPTHATRSARRVLLPSSAGAMRASSTRIRAAVVTGIAVTLPARPILWAGIGRNA